MASSLTRNPFSDPNDSLIISLSAMKGYLRIDSDDTTDDELIKSLILEATEVAEQHSNTVLLPSTVVEYYDNFPARDDQNLRLNRLPVTAVTSVEYYDDTTENYATFATTEYVASLTNVACIGLKPNKCYPVVTDALNRVKITYTAGYSDLSTVPPVYRKAIRHIVAEAYENRQDGASQKITLSEKLLQQVSNMNF